MKKEKAQKAHTKKERESTTRRKEKYLEALRETKGFIGKAMERAGIASRSTLKEWRKKDPGFEEAEQDVLEYCGDYVESKLTGLIEEGNVTAVVFYCKTKLKNRGYVERSELTGMNGKDIVQTPLTIEVIDSRDKVDMTSGNEEE